MADLQAFKGLRYDLAKVGSLDQVIAPPYDVIDESQQNQLYAVNEYNIVRLILNRAEENDGEDARYERAAKTLRSWLQNQVLVEESQPALYVYHQTFELDGEQVTRRGFMGRIKLEPLGTGRIFPHEETHSAAKADRFKLMSATGCNLSPIFSLYPDPENEIQNILEAEVVGTAPLSAKDHLGILHEMWPVTDSSAIAKAISLFSDLPMFIADGHHRYETSLNIRDAAASGGELPVDHPANYTLMMCVGMNDPGLSVLPTHRLFRGITEQSSNQLIAKIEKYFDCSVEASGPENGQYIWDKISGMAEQHALGFYCPADSNWVLAMLNLEGIDRLAQLITERSDEWRSLGVSILHEFVISEFYPEANDKAPKYVRSVDELIDGLVNGDQAGRDATGQSGSNQPFGLAAIVMPASVEDIRKISANGERMPAKSTYFYPKMLSGLVINPIR